MQFFEFTADTLAQWAANRREGPRWLFDFVACASALRQPSLGWSRFAFATGGQTILLLLRVLCQLSTAGVQCTVTGHLGAAAMRPRRSARTEWHTRHITAGLPPSFHIHPITSIITASFTIGSSSAIRVSPVHCHPLPGAYSLYRRTFRHMAGLWQGQVSHIPYLTVGCNMIAGVACGSMTRANCGQLPRPNKLNGRPGFRRPVETRQARLGLADDAGALLIINNGSGTGTGTGTLR